MNRHFEPLITNSSRLGHSSATSGESADKIEVCDHGNSGLISTARIQTVKPASQLFPILL